MWEPRNSGRRSTLMFEGVALANHRVRLHAVWRCVQVREAYASVTKRRVVRCQGQEQYLQC